MVEACVFFAFAGAKFCAHDCNFAGAKFCALVLNFVLMIVLLLVLNFVLMIVLLLVLNFVLMIDMSHMTHTLLANSRENDPGASLQPQLACSLSGYFGLAKL